MNNIEDFVMRSFNELLSSIGGEDLSCRPDFGFDLFSLFDKENNLNMARKALGKIKFKSLQRLYLKEIPPHLLKDKIESHEKVFKRYLGPEKFMHLKLISYIRASEKKKGLLAS